MVFLPVLISHNCLGICSYLKLYDGNRWLSRNIVLNNLRTLLRVADILDYQWNHKSAATTKLWKEGIIRVVAIATLTFYLSELMDFSALDKEVEAAAAADEKYQRENSAKFRAVEQKVATYDQFRDIVRASHLTPLDKKEKIADPNIQYKNVIWNTAAKERSESDIIIRSRERKRHFTEK